jgi:hypothetical protein
MIAAKTHSQIIHRRGFLVAGTAATALTPLNDAITREAFPRSIDCIDLRILCDDDRDFANPIEPPGPRRCQDRRSPPPPTASLA